MLRTIEEEVTERNKALLESTASSSDAPSSDHVCLVMFSSVHDLNEANCYGFKLSVMMLGISHNRAIAVAPRFYQKCFCQMQKQFVPLHNLHRSSIVILQMLYHVKYSVSLLIMC